MNNKYHSPLLFKGIAGTGYRYPRSPEWVEGQFLMNLDRPTIFDLKMNDRTVIREPSANSPD